MSSRYTQYHGVWLYTEQAEALLDIETRLETPIPDISNNSMGSFGFIHDNYNVIELRLFLSYFQEKAQLTELPDSIGNLTELNTLDVSHNKLSELPPSITNLEELEKFYLDYNEFATIPPVLAKLENLRQLNFDENALKIIPNTIGNAPYLQSLHLAGNFLTEFPTELSSLNYLKRLVLNRNKITHLDYNILEDFSRLYVLDLRSNLIPESELNKAIAFLKFAGIKRRKFYLKGEVRDWENPYSLHNIIKRLRSDPHVDIDKEDEEILDKMAVRIKLTHDKRYQFS